MEEKKTNDKHKRLQKNGIIGRERERGGTAEILEEKQWKQYRVLFEVKSINPALNLLWPSFN